MKIRLCQDKCSEGLKTSLADKHSIAQYSPEPVFSAMSILERFKERRLSSFWPIHKDILILMFLH